MNRLSPLPTLAAAAVLALAPSLPAPAQEIDPRIATTFDYEPHFVEVDGVRMHYVEAGQGDPILLLHGNPTSSYLWRNVIPLLQDQGRVIAPDLVGFGRSDRPDVDYTLQTHYGFVEGFIDALELQNVTLVLHDWGTVLGLTYALRHEDNVHAVALMEAIIPPAFPMSHYEDFGALEDTFRAFRDPETGPAIIVDENGFIEEVLPAAVVRPLRPEEMDAYRAPFAEPESRLPIYVWPNELPIEGEPARNVEAIDAVGDWMRMSETPKLLIYFEPGLIVTPDTARWMQQTYRNLQIRYGGVGSHYVQEDQPVAIGRHVADWLAGLPG